VLYPSDNSMIVVERQLIGSQNKTNTRVTKNKLSMGIDTLGTTFWYFHEDVRLTVQKEETG
jgi:hypothetical protein